MEKLSQYYFGDFARGGHAAGNRAPNNWPTSLTSNRHPQVPQPLTTAPHVAMSHCLPAWKFSFLARLPLTSPCLRFVLRVVPYLHVPANHRFPHISPAPLSPLIRQVSTDNFDSAMFKLHNGSSHRPPLSRCIKRFSKAGMAGPCHHSYLSYLFGRRRFSLCTVSKHRFPFMGKQSSPTAFLECRYVSGWDLTSNFQQRP
jgi:hypothetical protein